MPTLSPADRPTAVDPRPLAPCTHVVACLAYADADAAIAWLAEALGAAPGEVHRGPDGRVAHAELWFGDGCVMLGSLRTDGLPPTVVGQGAVYLVLPTPADVDARHARATVAGARVAIPLRDTDYGSHDFGCLDPEGNFWGFGTYAPRR